MAQRKGSYVEVDATCHYCARPAAFSMTIRSRATEDPVDQRQRVCEVHDAIVSSLRSVAVLERRPWHLLPPTVNQGTIIESDRSTLVQPRRARDVLRSLVGR